MKILCDKACATVNGKKIFLKNMTVIGTSCKNNTNFVHYADDVCTYTLQSHQVEIIKDIDLNGDKT